MEVAFKEIVNMPDPDIPLRVHISSSNGIDSLDVKPHFHDSVEILYVLHGNAIQSINNMRFNINEGDVVVINSLDVHSTFSEQGVNVSILVIMFDPSLLNGSEVGYSKPIFFIKQDDNPYVFRNNSKIAKILSDYLINIRDEYDSKNIGYELSIKGDVYKLLSVVIRNIGIKYWADENYKRQKEKMDRLKILLDYVDKNYNKAITLDEASKIVNMSRYHFCHFFKSTMGKSFFTFLNEARIKFADEMLKTTNLPISDIANKVGYNNVNYFNRQYKYFRHLTPTQFRKSTGKSNNEK